MSKAILRVVGDTVTRRVRFEHDGSQLAKELADFLKGLVEKADKPGEDLAKAVHFEQLAKEVEDRELRAYYAERAKEAREGGSNRA